MKRNRKRMLSALLACTMLVGFIPVAQAAGQQEISDVTQYQEGENTNVMVFSCGSSEVKLEFCTERTVRVELSTDGTDSYRPEDPEYYMVQDNNWPQVEKTVTEEDGVVSISTSAIEVRVQQSPFRIGMYDLGGNLLSKDSDETGLYWENDGTRGVKKVEGSQNAGGIFGFGSGDHGRRAELNRYEQDFSEFSMSHGRVVAPFFMSTVGYGIFLNTMEEDTTFFRHGGGFETQGYLDYFFMYGPDFKTILNEYAEITGRMELYGKWAYGFMLSKYGNDNATQEEFLEWLHKLRDEGYPSDCYVFDYGWRGGKFNNQAWDTSRFPDVETMFQEAEELGFHVGLHNNAGTPEANGGKNLYQDDQEWVDSYMKVVEAGQGDWFWPDEFDVLGSNSAPTFAAKGAYEAWIASEEVNTRPMFITRGSYAGQHYATAWSGDIENTSQELQNQIGFSLDAGLIGYWAVSHDLGGFMHRPSDDLYTRWVSEFGAWNGIMRAHGHDGREPWTYDETAQETLKENLQTRYALYPYTYSLAWQGYSQGVPMMRAMILEDDSQNNPDAWNLNEQYYYGDWFLVAPATATKDTVVSVWLPPHTTWYDYESGERYEGGESGKTITVYAPLEKIPVFVKAGAIVPMGPDVNYADEKPLDPLTLDIYPHEGTTSFTLYEDDGESRNYIEQEAYSTTRYENTMENGEITFTIHAREDHNPQVYQPVERSYNLKFNHISSASGVSINGSSLTAVESLEEYNQAAEAYWLDVENRILYVKTQDTGAEKVVTLDAVFEEPELGEENQGIPPQNIGETDIVELEDAQMQPVSGGEVKVDTEWKGYTGDGFAKGFKAAGDAVEFTVNVEKSGTYTLSLRVNCGKKNSSQYDDSPREGTLYLDGETLHEYAFTVTPTWGDSSKNGDWRSYDFETELSAGTHTFRFVAEGENNPGNYNLDSLTFTRKDTSISAFTQIHGDRADQLTNAALTEQGYLAFTDGGEARFAELTGTGRNGLEMRVTSQSGGVLTVYENGVGDKVLATVEIPAGADWHTRTVAARDVDAETSDVWFSFAGEDCQLDWFRFTETSPQGPEVETPLPDYLYWGDTLDLPDQLTVREGEQTYDVTVTWDAETVEQIQASRTVDTYTLTGTLSDGRTVTHTIATAPGNVVYFVDSGAADFTAQGQILVQANQDTMLNQNADVAYSQETGWGYLNGETTSADHVTTGSAYDTVRNMTKAATGKSLSYQFDGLKAGTYNVYIGYQDPWTQWSTTRPATITLNQGETNLATLKGVELCTSTPKYSTMENVKVGEDGTVTLTLAPEKTGNSNYDMLVSYILIAQVEEEPTHQHNLTVVEAKDPTCIEKGNIAYWYCEECGKYFSNAEATTEITKEDTELDMIPHTEETIPGKEATCTEDGLTEGIKCSVCGEILKAQEIIKAKGHHFENGVCTECGEKDPDATQVDKSLLQKTYDYAKAQDTSNLVSSAKEKFDAVMAKAEAVLQDKNATQEQVNVTWNELVDVIHALGLVKGEKDMLELVIAQAEAMMAEADKYVEANWQQLVDALDAAKAVMDDGDAMQGEVDEATRALLDAILAQRFKANKDILEDLIGQAQSINLDGYTAESASAFQAALAQAQAILADETLTEDDQKTVDVAVEQLTAAMDGLTAGGEPEVTDKPEATDQPQGSQKPEATQKPGEGKVPQTGDANQLTLYVAALVCTMLLLSTAVVVRKQTRK